MEGRKDIDVKCKSEVKVDMWLGKGLQKADDGVDIGEGGRAC